MENITLTEEQIDSLFKKKLSENMREYGRMRWTKYTRGEKIAHMKMMAEKRQANLLARKAKTQNIKKLDN